jgi:Arm DNA-binding domain
MGRRSVTGGVRAKGPDRIEFVFTYQGKRYRPSIFRKPTEANLRRARLQLNEIRQRIRYGTFHFLEEFPDYRYAENLNDTAVAQPSPVSEQTAPEQVALVRPSPAAEQSRPEQIYYAQPRPTEGRSCNEVFDEFLSYCETRQPERHGILHRK